MPPNHSPCGQSVGRFPSLYSFTQALKDGNRPTDCPQGLWLGGIKYTVTQNNANFEVGEATDAWFFGAAPKKGVHVMITKSDSAQIMAAFYDEEKGQTSGNALKALSAFAEYLAGIGY